MALFKSYAVICRVVITIIHLYTRILMVTNYNVIIMCIEHFTVYKNSIINESC